MKITDIEAKTLSEAWFLCISRLSGYSVYSHGGDNRTTYVKNGLFLDVWIDYRKQAQGRLSLVTPQAITVTTFAFDIPNPHFDTLEANILSVQLALKEAGIIP